MTSLFSKIQKRLLALSSGEFDRSELSAEIGGRYITQVAPIKDTGITKSGNISLTGICDKKRVKIFTMFSEGQVKLRISLDRLSNKIFLPPLVAVEGRVVIEEWVTGVAGDKSIPAVRDLMARAVRDFIASRQRRGAVANYGLELVLDFDYLDYLENRADQWSFLSEVRIFLTRWRQQRNAVKEMLVLELSHPDLTLQNLVLTDEDRIFCIDNEFLHVGLGGFMDYYNSFINEGEYPFKADSSVKAFYRNTKKLRHIGSALITGRPNKLSADAFMFDSGG